MERILVLGPCGAGKSTLAVKLGELLGLPVIHLDQEYWRPGWTEPPKQEWSDRVEELVARPRWVMDGNYSGTFERRLARAQLVVSLDYPRSVFFPRLVWRSVSQLGRTRADMAPGCREQIDLAFFRYAWRFRTDTQPRHLALVKAAEVPVVRLTSPRETEAWLAAGAPLEAPTLAIRPARR